MRKLISLILIAAICLSIGAVVQAEETYQLTVSDAVVVTVNGEEVSGTVSVTDEDEVKILVDSEDAAVVGANGKYYDVNTVFSLTEDTDLTEARAYKPGLSMVEGAQVRVGNMKVSDGDKIDSGADNGLRFIAVADYTDTVISDENVEFGIKVTAEGCEEPVYIKAEKFQNDDDSVFTAAITNLAASNYNRKYTACAYALVPLADGTVKELGVGSVTRSIYQVSVGIMKNSSAEAEDNMPYTIDDAVKNVLNAYINQTGIRLTYFADGSVTARTSGSGAYTGDVFFDVEYSLNGDGSTDVVVTPYGSADGFGNPVTIASWWKDYIRINNNNTVASEYISDVKLEGGALSFKFTVPGTEKYAFNQDDNVTIVSEISSSHIKGFKAGAEVEYNICDDVYIMGLATTLSDIVPGSVVLTAHNTDGDVAAIELLASLGIPVNPDEFEADFGVYEPSDGSNGYKNIVTEMYSKSGTKVTCQSLPDTTKTAYKFESSSSMCYRVGIAMDGETPVITVTGAKISAYPSVFGSTADYHNYLYLRYNNETEKVKECVFYCVPKDFDFSGDGEYSDIFSLDDYRVIIE